MQIRTRPGLHQHAGAFPFKESQMNKTSSLQPRQSRPGFSLVELVIVVAITGVIAGIAVPRFADASSGRQLQASKNQLLLDIETAKLRARATSTQHTLKFYVDENMYVIAEGNTVDRDTIIIARSLDDDPYYTQIKGTDLGGDQVMVITAFGDISPPATVRIQSIDNRIDISIEGIADTGVVPVVTSTVEEVTKIISDGLSLFGASR